MEEARGGGGGKEEARCRRKGGLGRYIRNLLEIDELERDPNFSSVVEMVSFFCTLRKYCSWAVYKTKLFLVSNKMVSNEGVCTSFPHPNPGIRCDSRT